MAQIGTPAGRDPDKFHDCFQLAQALLRRSADLWAHGDPEDPPTEEVLKKILKIFEDQRFVRRPW